MEVDFATDILSENATDRTSTIHVTSSDGSNSKAYLVEYFTLSSESRLSNLTLSLGELDTTFDPDTTKYTATVPSGTTETPSISCVTKHIHAIAEVIDALDINHSNKAYRTSTVKVISEFGKPYTQEYKILFKMAVGTGIKNRLVIGDLKVYPNPFKSDVTLEWKTIKVIDKIEMVNLLGQKVRTIVNPSGNKASISRENLPSGIYFLKVHSDDTLIIKVVME